MNNEYFEQFTAPVRKIGKTSLVLAMLFSFLPGLYIALAYKAMPTIGQIAAGYVMAVAGFGVYYFVEPVSYFTTLGEAGTFMSFLAGSISSIRVVAVGGTQTALGVKPGTRKAELVAVIAIAASVIASLICNIAAVFAGQAILAALPARVAHAVTTYIVPASFGAFITAFFKQAPAVGVFALVLGLCLNFAVFIPLAVKTLLAVGGTMLFGIWYAKKKEKKASAAK